MWHRKVLLVLLVIPQQECWVRLVDRPWCWVSSIDILTAKPNPFKSTDFVPIQRFLSLVIWAVRFTAINPPELCTVRIFARYSWKEKKILSKDRAELTNAWANFFRYFNHYVIWMVWKQLLISCISIISFIESLKMLIRSNPFHGLNRTSDVGQISRHSWQLQERWAKLVNLWRKRYQGLGSGKIANTQKTGNIDHIKINSYYIQLVD